MSGRFGPNVGNPSVVEAERDTDWMAQSACGPGDTHLFFGGAETAPAAKTICTGGCPVIDSCRSYALRIPDLEGGWGGMDEKERRRYRDGLRRRRRSA